MVVDNEEPIHKKMCARAGKEKAQKRQSRRECAQLRGEAFERRGRTYAAYTVVL